MLPGIAMIVGAYVIFRCFERAIAALTNEKMDTAWKIVIIILAVAAGIVAANALAGVLSAATDATSAMPDMGQ